MKEKPSTAPSQPPNPLSAGVLGPAPERPRGADRLYQTPRPVITDFDFGPDTAAVFDDMLQRSVPFYNEIQRMIAELVADFAVDGTNVYDIGCSTCATFRRLRDLPQDVTFVGIDGSTAMLAQAERELARSGFDRRYVLKRQDIHESLVLENASVAILSLTLQFVRPIHRERVLREIHAGLNPGGCLIVVEKVLAHDALINRLFIRHYHDFKRRKGYSDLEIAQKREALENVLIPYRLSENETLLRAAGFRACETFFRWYNFSGILALK